METNKTNNRNKTLKICMFGVFTALYVVANSFLHFNVFGNVTTDFAYVVYAIALVFFGIEGTWVGVLGVAITSTLTSAWGFSPSWVVMNAIIGLGCGFAFKYSEQSLGYRIGVGLAYVFLGLCAKTIIEYFLYGVPLSVKIPKALVCWVVDGIAFTIGLMIAYVPALKKFSNYFNK